MVSDVSSLETCFFRDNPSWAQQRRTIDAAIDMLCHAFTEGHLIMTCGNGGGAADSEHMVAELVKAFKAPRPLLPSQRQALAGCTGANGEDVSALLERGVRAISLTGPATLLSAIANDKAADMVFAQQVFVLGRANDILVVFSSSGSSPNVVCALQVAKAFGLQTIGFTGRASGTMDAFCDILFKADAEETYRIQELHLPLYHYICATVENALFGATCHLNP